MGVDYYRYTALKITYKDDKYPEYTREDYDKYKNEYYYHDHGLLILEQKGYYFCSSYDSDSEGDFDRKWNEVINHRSKKNVYVDGKWIISSKEKIKKYEKYIKYMDNIINLDKITWCEERP